MVFDIQGKVALISGGASGIGLQYAIHLLKNGLKGVTIADINESFGKKALEEIQNKFGSNKAIFVKTDVTKKDSYEEAFKKTIETFKNLDILINNAGIADEKNYEKEIAVNILGTVNGVILGLETYIPKYKSGDEGLIVNISSVAGLGAFGAFPVYTATKHAIVGLTKAYGKDFHYNRSKVRVIAICPGLTETPLFYELSGKTYSREYAELLEKEIVNLAHQGPEDVAAAAIKVIQNAKSASLWIIEGNKEPYEFNFKKN